MTPTGALALFSAAWVAIGFGTAYLMARRGHDLFTWWYLGAVLGPLAIPIAISRRSQNATTGNTELKQGTAGAGSIDVLIGVDGSPESETAISDAIRLLGSRIGRLALATVEDFDAATRTETTGPAMLEKLAANLPYRHPATVILTGRPAKALLRYADEGAFHLLVVGSRGRGMSKMLLGSVAKDLARSASIPVLISHHKEGEAIGKPGPERP